MKTKNKFLAMTMAAVIAVMSTISTVCAEEKTTAPVGEHRVEWEVIYQESTGHTFLYAGYNGKLIATIAVKDGNAYDMTRHDFIAEGELKDVRSIQFSYNGNPGEVTHDDIWVDWISKDNKVYMTDLATMGRLYLEKPLKLPHNEIEESMPVAKTTFTVPETTTAAAK